MRESRRIDIKNKRFERDDILGLARIFVEQAQRAKKGDRQYQLSLGLGCKDGTHYQSESLDLFEKGSTADLNPPASVELAFQDYSSERGFSLSLVHGSGGYRDGFEVKGGDSKWVHDIFMKAKERIDAIRPTDVWCIRHPQLTYNLIALCIGSIVLDVLAFLIGILPITLKINPEWQNALEILFRESPFVGNLCRLLFAWLVGQLWAYPVKEWLFGAWPSIELDFGPEHLRLEKQRRLRLFGFVTLVLLPIVVNCSPPRNLRQPTEK